MARWRLQTLLATSAQQGREASFHVGTSSITKRPAFITGSDLSATKREAAKAARRAAKVDTLDMNEPDAGAWEEVKARLGLVDGEAGDAK
jgi:hypothetical protein